MLPHTFTNRLINTTLRNHNRLDLLNAHRTHSFTWLLAAVFTTNAMFLLLCPFSSFPLDSNSICGPGVEATKGGEPHTSILCQLWNCTRFVAKQLADLLPTTTASNQSQTAATHFFA